LALQASGVPSPAALYLVLTYIRTRCQRGPKQLDTLAIRTSSLQQLDTLAIRTRLSGSEARKSSNWTLWLSAQAPSSNWTLWLSAQDFPVVRPENQATGQSSYPHKSSQATGHSSYPHKSLPVAPSNWTAATAKESLVRRRTPYSSSSSSVKKDIRVSPKGRLGLRHPRGATHLPNLQGA
jgi:hypothetical protein